MKLEDVLNLMNNSHCTLQNIWDLAEASSCTIIEMVNGETVVCFGKHLFNTYRKAIIVNKNERDTFKYFSYCPKIKINSRQVIYKINKTKCC